MCCMCVIYTKVFLTQILLLNLVEEAKFNNRSTKFCTISWNVMHWSMLFLMLLMFFTTPAIDRCIVHWGVRLIVVEYLCINACWLDILLITVSLSAVVRYVQSTIVTCITQTATIIATLPQTMHPQHWAEPHTFTYNTTLEQIHAPIPSVEWLNSPLLSFIPFHNLSSWWRSHPKE